VSRHLRSCVGLLLAFALASCSKDTALPTGPEESPQAQPAPSNEAFLVAQSCSPDSIKALAKAILPGPLGTLVGAKLAQLDLDRTGGRIDRARARMFEIVDALVKARNGGLFANDTPKRLKLEALIKLLFCLVGLPTPPIDLGPDGGAAVITPTSPPTVVQTGNLRAGTQVTTGAVPQTVLVTITKLAKTGGWLDTQLDQYGPGYEFTVTPNLPFNQDVLAGVCINSTGNTAVDLRLRLAHNNATGPLATGNDRFGNIEIINQPAPLDLSPLGLNCTVLPAVGFLQRAAYYLLPEPLFAAVSPATTGGKVRSFSPFAAVDPLLAVSPNSALAQSGTAGAQAGVLPSVKVLTTQGNPVNLVSIAFAPGGTVATAGSGTATVGSWLLALGQNTLTATATAPGLSFTGSPVNFTATGVSPTTPFDWTATGWSWKLLGTDGLPPSAEAIATAVSNADGYSGPAQGAFSMVEPPDTYCSVYSEQASWIHSTVFGQNQILAFRRDFVMPDGAPSGTMEFAMDNDFKVYVNGTDRTSDVVFAGGGTSTGTDESGFRNHDGCPNRVDFRLYLTGLSSLSNTVVIIALDRGGSTYFDASVRLGD
jgi:hypothetical protein